MVPFGKRDPYHSHTTPIFRGTWKFPWLVGGNSNIFVIFTPKIGEDEPILTCIFFKGVVKNHQLGKWTGKSCQWRYTLVKGSMAFWRHSQVWWRFVLGAMINQDMGVVSHLLSRWWFQIFLSFSYLFGGMIQFHEHIFQMGGSTTN